MLTSIFIFICYILIGFSENLSNVLRFSANIRERCPFLCGEELVLSLLFSFGQFSLFLYLTDSY